MVNYYKEVGKEVTAETLYSVCRDCVGECESRYGVTLEYIDKAPTYEPCVICEDENVQKQNSPLFK